MTDTILPSFPQPGAAPADVAQALEALQTVLRGSADLVKTGQMVDLAGLDREVQGALNAVIALPPADARAMLPALDGLMAVLDDIAADLQRVHGAALGGSETTANRLRAASAYRRTDDL